MIQLCDFGYSLMSGVNADDDEARGLNPGTAPYIAPEVYAAKRRAAATLAAGERGEANEAAGDVVRKSCMLDWQGWQRADVYSLTMMVWGLFRANATPFFPNVDISDKSTRGKEKLLGELVEKGERPYLESKDKDVEQGLRPLWDKLLAHAESPLARGWSQMPTERPTAKKMLEQMRQCTLDGTLQGGGGSGDLSLLTLPSTSPLSTPKPRPPAVPSSKFEHGTERIGADGYSRGGASGRTCAAQVSGSGSARAPPHPSTSQPPSTQPPPRHRDDEDDDLPLDQRPLVVGGVGVGVGVGGGGGVGGGVGGGGGGGDSGRQGSDEGGKNFGSGTPKRRRQPIKSELPKAEGGGVKRPRGRAPKGKEWDRRCGGWVAETGTPASEPTSPERPQLGPLDLRRP